MSAGEPTGRRLHDCGRPLAEAYDVGLYDLDGVLYLGRDAVPHASESVRQARERGLRPAYVTNNASRAAAEVAEHLTELGIPATAADVVTSAQAAVTLVRQQVPEHGAVLVLGTEALADEARAVGLRPVRTVEQAGPGGPLAVLQGIAPDTAWRDLAEACLALRAGAVWVAGNLDATLPTARGQLPGNGAMVAALRTATGLEPLVAGKPEPALHTEAVRRTGATHPLVVGDRLDTDVLGAVRAEADSLLVLTGVADLPALLAAPAGTRPSFVAADLRALLVDQPRVVLDGTEARCGRARAVRTGDRVVVRLDGAATVPAESGRSGVADSVAALRAACSLVWHGADQGLALPKVDGLSDGGLPA